MRTEWSDLNQKLYLFVEYESLYFCEIVQTLFKPDYNYEEVINTNFVDRI